MGGVDYLFSAVRQRKPVLNFYYCLLYVLLRYFFQNLCFVMDYIRFFLSLLCFFYLASLIDFCYYLLSAPAEDINFCPCRIGVFRWSSSSHLSIFPFIYIYMWLTGRNGFLTETIIPMQFMSSLYTRDGNYF